jgi:hypothetical protein
MNFLRANNEKPTRKFCKLGKECSTVDDLAQIEKPGGGDLRMTVRELNTYGFFTLTYTRER